MVFLDDPEAADRKASDKISRMRYIKHGPNQSSFSKSSTAFSGCDPEENQGDFRLSVNVTVFYSFKTVYSSGEIDYVKTYQKDYKNKAIRDRFASSPVVREKETLWLPQLERIDNHFTIVMRILSTAFKAIARDHKKIYVIFA